MGQEKIDEEFNIANLIKKVRMSNDLWKNILKKDQIKLMRMQKSGVIDLDASDQSDEASSVHTSDTNDDNTLMSDPETGANQGFM